MQTSPLRVKNHFTKEYRLFRFNSSRLNNSKRITLRTHRKGK